MELPEEYPRPEEVSDAEMAFGGDMAKLMVPYSQLPTQFKTNSLANNRDFEPGKFIRDWFHKGIHIDKVVARDGIDAQAAFRHINAIMGSFAPKHEHKIGACAYFAACWFERVVSTHHTYTFDLPDPLS